MKNDSKYSASLSHIEKALITNISEILGTVPHPGEKGSEIENKIREVLTSILPEKIGVSSGFVIDSDGNESKQMDIILYDKMNTPKIRSGDNGEIFPVELTYFCGEVKSILDSQALEDSFEKCLSYKRLQRKAYYNKNGPIESTFKIYGRETDHWESIFFCISYTSINYDSLLKTYNALLSKYKSPINLRIDTILTLKNGGDSKNIILNAKTDSVSGEPLDHSVNLCPYPGSCLGIYNAKSPLVLFICLLLYYATQVRSEFIYMVPYFGELYT